MNIYNITSKNEKKETIHKNENCCCEKILVHILCLKQRNHSDTNQGKKLSLMGQQYCYAGQKCFKQGFMGYNDNL